MGGLLNLLKPDGEVTTDVFVDFENAKPTPEEMSLYSEVSEKLLSTKPLIQALKSYTGCGEQIRRAISSPGKQTEEEAWAAVCPAVSKLKEFFDFSAVLNECFVSLLKQLCNTTEGSDVRTNLEKYQATANLLARILIFALDFDDLKTSNPSIQNDFSYYRRTLSRVKVSQEHRDMLEKAVVKDELANRMSLFYAYPTPMLKVLVDGLTSVNDIPSSNITDCFSMMVSICHVCVAENKFKQPETNQFCLRVMVACIILFDHVHPKGAFYKEGEINIRSHIRLIQTDGGALTDNLLNALRFTTKHLNDESTPKAIKSLLA